VLALGIAAFAAAGKDETPRCDNCGMFMAKSATQVHATFTIDGKKHEHKFVCLDCIYEFSAKTYDGALPTSVQVLDYTTFGTDKPVLLDANKAWFLYGTGKLAGSMQPYIAAFATKEAAQAQQAALGGELIQFAAVQDQLLKELAEEAEPAASAGDGEIVYVCPCTGDCCTDIRTTEPGSCPKCGMELVPESK
jgi:nitrous oxide reductase accessory protein NosL